MIAQGGGSDSLHPYNDSPYPLEEGKTGMRGVSLGSDEAYQIQVVRHLCGFRPAGLHPTTQK